MPIFSDITNRAKGSAKDNNLGGENSFVFGRKWKVGKDGWRFDDSIKAKIEGREEIKMQDANAQ